MPGLSLGSYFFVRPVAWSAPLAITGLKIEAPTGLRCSFCQYMGLLALAMMTTHETVWKLPGLPLYSPAPGWPFNHFSVSSNTLQFMLTIKKKNKKTWNNKSSLPSGYAGYKLCYYEVMKVIKGIVHQPYEVKGNSIFYAFSYYFDRAVETGLIGEWAHAKSPSSTIISRDNYHLMHQAAVQIACCFFFCIDDRGGVLEVRDFKKRAKEGRSRFPKTCTLQHCSELYAKHMKTKRLFGTENHKTSLGSAHPDDYDQPFAKTCCKTHKSQIAAAAWCRRRVGVIDRRVRYVRPFGLEEGAWLGPGWQLSWGSLSGPGRRAPDSYTPPIWHHHPPTAWRWPSAPHTSLLTHQNGHLLITSHAA